MVITQRIDQLIANSAALGYKAEAILIGPDQAREFKARLDEALKCDAPFVDVEYRGLKVRTHPTIDGIVLIHDSAIGRCIAGEPTLPF